MHERPIKKVKYQGQPSEEVCVLMDLLYMLHLLNLKKHKPKVLDAAIQIVHWNIIRE